ncbi:MAG: hypothetical protein JO307_13175 [Bryobacterales bacterium]|nr:hypothetical protein [Bryobacterales bacterium]
MMYSISLRAVITFQKLQSRPAVSVISPTVGTQAGVPFVQQLMFGVAALACLSASSRVQADQIILGSVGFTDIGTTTTDTGSISTATTFTLGNWTTTGGTGIFAGMPIQSFGPVSFNITDPSSFTFGNGVFGTFAATSLTSVGMIPPIFLGLTYDGLWTPGTQGGLTGGPFPSSLHINFDQGGGPDRPF